MRHLAMTGMVTACMIDLISIGSDMRATPPSLRMSAGTRSSAITAHAPASWAILACSAVTTSMITPPFSICASPAFSLKVPLAARCPFRDPLDSAIEEILRVAVRVSALAACAALVLALASLPAAAASGGLSSMLAPAPGADWVESQPAPTVLEGPFDAHAYAAYVQALAPRSPSMENALR